MKQKIILKVLLIYKYLNIIKYYIQMKIERCNCRKNLNISGIFDRCPYKSVDNQLFCKRHLSAKTKLLFNEDIETYLIKHKKKFRNYFLNEVYKLRGCEFINKCINKTDFYTCISLEDMNNDYIFLYENNNIAFFFDIRSFQKLLHNCTIIETMVTVEKNKIILNNKNDLAKIIHKNSLIELYDNINNFNIITKIKYARNNVIFIEDSCQIDYFNNKKIIINNSINPYTQKILPYYVIKRFMKLKEYLNYGNIKLDLFKDLEFSNDRKMFQKTLKIFQKLLKLNYNVDADWFLNLNLLRLRRFYKELYNIWNFRANLSKEQKLNIIFPYKNLFIKRYNYVLTLRKKLELKNIILNILDKLINYGKTKEDQNTGALYIIRSLTIISKECRNIYNWLIL